MRSLTALAMCLTSENCSCPRQAKLGNSGSASSGPNAGKRKQKDKKKKSQRKQALSQVHEEEIGPVCLEADQVLKPLTLSTFRAKLTNYFASKSNS